MFVWSNLTQLSISRAPHTIRSHLNFMKIISKSFKNFSVITFFNGFQFWGESQKDNMIEGDYFSNYDDYSTISNKHIFRGIFSSKTTSLVYEGFFQNGLPHFIGSFKINRILVYKGFVKDGYPHGKGKIYYKDGDLMFSGMLKKGFPIRGVYYNLPKIYKGEVYIKNQSSYKFSFRRLNLMAKSLDYERMLTKFKLEGMVFHSARELECAEGVINLDSNHFNGKFKMTAESGDIFHGSIVQSKMLGYGFLNKFDGMKFQGKWSQGCFEGRLILPENFKMRADTLTNAEIETVSRYEEVKKILNFNENVNEVQGVFKIKKKKLRLKRVGVIVYSDGSEYRGMVKNNQMHGYGRMVYSTGEIYKGTWNCNQIHGIGEYRSKDLRYRGQFFKGVLHGFGILNYKKQIIKGEWKKGNLVYAMIDKFENQKGELKKDKLVFKVIEELKLPNQRGLKIVGPCEVKFTESSSRSVSKPDQTVASSKKTDKHLCSRSITDLSSSRAKITDSHIFSTKTGYGFNKRYEFIGEFVRKGENEDLEFFKDEKIVGYGYLVSGKRVVFMGIVDLEFSKLFGIKFDYESQTEIIGGFNKEIELVGFGVKSDGVMSFEGRYQDGKREGLVLEMEKGEKVSLGYFSGGERHGLSLIFNDGKGDLRRYVKGEIATYYR